MKIKDCNNIMLTPAANGVIVEEAYRPSDIGRDISNLERHVFNNMDDLFNYLHDHFVAPADLLTPKEPEFEHGVPVKSCDREDCPNSAVWKSDTKCLCEHHYNQRPIDGEYFSRIND